MNIVTLQIRATIIRYTSLESVTKTLAICVIKIHLCNSTHIRVFDVRQYRCRGITKIFLQNAVGTWIGGSRQQLCDRLSAYPGIEALEIHDHSVSEWSAELNENQHLSLLN